MKKLILILLCFPLLSFGQNVIVFTKRDLVINQILHNTAKYFSDKNTPKVEFRFLLKKSNIDWNKEKFSKWKINSKVRRNPKDKSMIIK